MSIVASENAHEASSTTQAFQVWQEGVARYSEYRVAELASKKYEPQCCVIPKAIADRI